MQAKQYMYLSSLVNADLTNTYIQFSIINCDRNMTDYSTKEMVEYTSLAYLAMRILAGPDYPE